MNTVLKTKYDSIAMSLHWLIAVLMIGMLMFGEDLIETRGQTEPSVLPSIHVSIGVAILLLSVLRLSWRLFNRPPSYPLSMKPWERYVSTTTHVLFYVLMIGLPLTGWLSFTPYLEEHPILANTNVFGLFPVPSAPDLGEVGGALHGLGGNLAIALVVLHVLAALKHHFYNRDDVLRRMLPG